MGRLAASVATDSVTATWQLSCLPSCPQYWRATPTECRPFLGMPVSSTIHAAMGPRCSIAAKPYSRTALSTASSSHGGIGDQVMQRLVGLAHPLGRQQGRHRLDTFARAGQYQTGQITTQRLVAIGVAQALRQAFHINPKALRCRAQKSLYRLAHIMPSLLKYSMRGGIFNTVVLSQRPSFHRTATAQCGDSVSQRR